MEAISLPAAIRDLKEKARQVRLGNRIPAIYYGHNQKNIPLVLDYQTFLKVYRKAGESTVIDLKVDGEKVLKALIHEIQKNPVTDRISHIDFVHVSLTEEVTARIALQFVGQAPAVKDLSGVLVTQKNEITVRALPQDLIRSIEVDLSPLVDFQSMIRVSDLKLPPKITVLDDQRSAVVTVAPPRAEEEVAKEEEVVAGAEAAVEEKAEGEKAEGEAAEKAPEEKEKKNKEAY